MDRRGAHLARVVRRDRGRHADRDPGGAVRQQVRKRAGQDDGFGFLAVVGRAEIHRVVVDAGQHRRGDLGQPRLGVAHRGRVIAVDVAEIALALNQREARGEILRHAHHGVVDRGVAMRMVFAHHVADHAGAFLEPGRGIEAQLVHRVDQPPVHRLQPVAHIRQRARHDGGQRIGQVALGQRVRRGWCPRCGRSGHPASLVSELRQLVGASSALPPSARSGLSDSRRAPRRGRIASAAPPAADGGGGRTRRAPGNARSTSARRASPPPRWCWRRPGSRAAAAAARPRSPAAAAVTARPVRGET